MYSGNLSQCINHKTETKNKDDKYVIKNRQELNKTANKIYFSNLMKYSTYDTIRFQMLLIFMEIQLSSGVMIDKFLETQTLNKIISIDNQFKINSNISNEIDRQREMQRIINYIF